MDTPTNEYFIEKSRMPVALMLLGGKKMRGELFIQASSRNFSALEDAPEFMNSSDRFFPLRLDDNRTVIVSRDHVISVDVPSEFAAGSSWSYGERARVEVVMQGGFVHTGQLSLEHYVGHARVLDHLNRQNDPFMILEREDGVTLLNRSHIAYLRPLDDASA